MSMADAYEYASLCILPAQADPSFVFIIDKAFERVNIALTVLVT
jgi:hypothetical protein